MPSVPSPASPTATTAPSSPTSPPASSPVSSSSGRYSGHNYTVVREPLRSSSYPEHVLCRGMRGVCEPQASCGWTWASSYTIAFGRWPVSGCWKKKMCEKFMSRGDWDHEKLFEKLCHLWKGKYRDHPCLHDLCLDLFFLLDYGVLQSVSHLLYVCCDQDLEID